MTGATSVPRTPGDLREWSVAQFMFRDGRIAPFIWLVVRLYLGYEWLSAGLDKLGGAAWTGSAAGTAVGGFVKGALAKSTGDHAQVTDWEREQYLLAF